MKRDMSSVVLRETVEMDEEQAISERFMTPETVNLPSRKAALDSELDFRRLSPASGLAGASLTLLVLLASGVTR